MNKLKKLLNATFLCLKYPFLYPRNRFTDRHTTSILGNYRYKLYNKSVQEITVTGKLEKEGKLYPSITRVFDYTIVLDRENKKLMVKNGKTIVEHDLKSLLGRNDKFQILGIAIRFSIIGHPTIIVYVKTIDDSDKTNYGFGYQTINFVTNKFKYKYYKFVKWFDENILDRLLFLPTYTELDAMPEGWRKAFGLQMCDEIKKELKKYKGTLRKYRIHQIKEKWGELCWYDGAAPEEVFKIIRKYAELSRQTCINCGKPAKYISRGWISPYCEECAKDKDRYISMEEDHAWDKALSYYWK